MGGPDHVGSLTTGAALTTGVCFQVRVAALQNLVKIMSLYYQYMETYMGPALFAVRPAALPLQAWCLSSTLICSGSPQITVEAMKSDMDEVALQGIEFWSNVCDEEMDLAIEASEVRRRPVSRRHQFDSQQLLRVCSRPITGLGAGPPPRAQQ